MTDRLRALAAAAGLLAAGALAAGCGSQPHRPPPATASPPPGSVVVQMDGADYGAPIYEEVGNQLQGSGVTLNYKLLAPGSEPARLGHGPVGLLAGSSSTELGNLPFVRDSAELYVPVGFGATAVTYNLRGLRAPLRLTGRALADIYLGRVRTWNAHEIRAINPGVSLPHESITIVHRSDAATATDLFTRYLSENSARWKNGPGHGVSISWPTGTGEGDDATVRQTVAETPGAIGYTEQDSALQNRLPTVRLRNPAGRYVGPTLPAIAAAGTQSHSPGELSLTTIDSRAPAAYPASAELFMLAVHDGCDAGLSHPEAAGVQRVLEYVLGPGQRVVRQFSFAPLPRALREQARDEVRRMRCGGQEI